MPTIYSVKSDYLLKDADEIERSAKESLKTWILLGQTEKYSEAMRLVRALRDAAETRSLYTRREILRNAGFSIKSPKQTAKDIQGQTRKANPMKKPTPAQIAARERFAEMARSGAFKKKAAKARKKNPMVISKQADESLSRQGSRGYVRKLLDRYSDEGHVVSVKKTRLGSIGIAFDGGRMLTVASARKKLEDHYGITERMGRRANPRASNPIILVSDKAIATKRKRNPVNALSIKYACVMPEPGGMAYGIDERTPVTIRFSASELKRAYKCYLIPANVRESAGYKRLIAKQKEVYMSLAELKQLFRSFV